MAVPHGDEAAKALLRDGYAGVGSSSILGFYALSSAIGLVEALRSGSAKRYSRQIPVTRLGRLATRFDIQGQGLGRLL